MVITGQQKMLLDKWEKGLVNNERLYKFVQSRHNDIPTELITNGDFGEVIRFIIKKSIVYTDPHGSINFYNRIKYNYNLNRLEHRNRLKRSGVIA